MIYTPLIQLQFISMIVWLQNWYISRCNNEWEHTFGVEINTIDNPGWSVTIDLNETKLELLEISYILNEKSEVDWIGYSIINKQFKGVGDPQKLNEIIIIFKKIWESY